ncbi:MAG: hypothetical protein QM713_10090 [Arachnia sp.]
MTMDEMWDLAHDRLFWAGVLANGVTTDEGAVAIEAAIPPRPANRADLERLLELATGELTGMLALLSDDEPRWTANGLGTVGDIRAAVR